MNSITQIRNRATYYKQDNGWTPKFIRRFLIRHPKAPLHITLGALGISFVSPLFYWTYKYYTMPLRDFEKYRDDRNAEVLRRQRFGTGLVFPWTTTKDDTPSS
uniref:NADH-ubiquinone oxidoreductase B15 subunit n=1 Tax=Rhabditophanes sp. KR3021 TaxID=114890 RepID=A0AC35TQ08_9BILA